MVGQRLSWGLEDTLQVIYLDCSTVHYSVQSYTHTCVLYAQYTRIHTAAHSTVYKLVSYTHCYVQDNLQCIVLYSKTYKVQSCMYSGVQYILTYSCVQYCPVHQIHSRGSGNDATVTNFEVMANCLWKKPFQKPRLKYL